MQSRGKLCGSSSGSGQAPRKYSDSVSGSSLVSRRSRLTALGSGSGFKSGKISGFGKILHGSDGDYGTRKPSRPLQLKNHK